MLNNEKQPPEKGDFVFKVILCGDASVGKTSLVQRFIYDRFSHTMEPTIGIDFQYKHLELNDKKINLQIWDTAGQERFQSVIKAHYRGAAGAMIVYDISKRDSYNKVSFWLSQVKEAVGQIPTILIGNKKDQEVNREVTYDEAYKLAEENGLIFLETSAMTSENVEEVFIKMVRETLTIAQAHHVHQEILTHVPKPQKSSFCGCGVNR